MDPTIQLIQLMLRVEREATVSDSDNLAAEKPVHPTKPDNQIKGIFNLPRRRQQGECL